jgi:hypothetical protein
VELQVTGVVSTVSDIYAEIFTNRKKTRSICFVYSGEGIPISFQLWAMTFLQFNGTRQLAFRMTSYIIASDSLSSAVIHEAAMQANLLHLVSRLRMRGVIPSSVP